MLITYNEWSKLPDKDCTWIGSRKYLVFQWMERDTRRESSASIVWKCYQESCRTDWLENGKIKEFHYDQFVMNVLNYFNKTLTM